MFIDDTCNLETAMKRLLWGKMLNLGQTCIAPDYILCSSQTQNKIVDLTRSIIKEWFGDSPKDSPDLCRVVSERHFDRLVGLMNSSSGKIVYGKYWSAKFNHFKSKHFLSVTFLESLILH